jgi:DMSO/TMAO reductase YedYZ molybdopterin-dependent catalytic subunit
LRAILTRRHFFLLTVGLFSQPGPRQAVPEMVVRSLRPADLEMPLEGFSDFITPVDRFFVRTHVYAPQIVQSEWRLQVDGDVDTPLTMTLEDIRRMPAVELVSVLECAGNGRGFYEPSVPGLQWGHGAIGNGRWRGVRLADVLRRAGVRATAKHVLFDGADVALGTMPDFRRSIPLTKALDSSTLRPMR